MAFEAPYGFGRDDIEVVIQHPGGKFLRVNPQNNQGADPNGGKGKWARFVVERMDGGSKCKLKSKETGKYLRIEPNANMGAEDKIDIKGGGGKWAVFKVHKQGSPGVVKLESAEQAGKYLAVHKDGVMRIGGGGPWTVMKFQRQAGGAGGAGGQPFTKPYQFGKTNTVVIQHKGGGDFDKFLRINPQANDAADPAGGKGAWAQFEADPQDGGSKVRFKSTKSGKYLRIIDNGDKVDVGGGGGKFTVFKVAKQGDGTVKLESNVFAGKYLAVGKNNVIRTGGGGPWCAVKIFRQN